VSRRERQRRQRRRRTSPLRRALVALAAILAAVLLGGGVVLASWVADIVRDTPDIAELQPKPLGTVSTVYASDGTRLGFISSDTLRRPVAGSRIPLVMKQATVAIEDRRFYRHHGVDYVGIVRAAIKNATSDETTQGGSTLTMQLVRNLYVPENRFEKTVTRKIREAKLASQLEQEHSKQWILVAYLNNVPFGTVGGQTAIGVQAAARIFFDKPASELTLPEAALLAGLPQAPSQYNPFLNERGARSRRAEVLRAMVSAGYIDEADAVAANAAPLGVEANGYYARRREPFVFDYVKEQLLRRYGAAVVRAGGLKVYTSIDLKLQEAARAAIAANLPYSTDPSSAVVTIDPSTGHILAMASSASYGETVFNYAAQAHRQPGSVFKVPVLMAALREGIDPDATSYASRHLTPGWLPGYPTYEVETYGHSYSGSMSITRATLASDNTVFAQLAADVTPEAVRQAAYDMGVRTKLNAYPAEALGGLTIGVSPLEMAASFATLANGGIRLRPTAILRVVHRDGRVDQLGKVKRKRTFSEAETGEATKVLRANMTGGTGTNAYYGCPAAGKTGTTSDYKDAWFVGYTPNLSTAVWVGYADPPQSMYSVRGVTVAGSTFPSAIWNDYMTVAHGDDCSDFPVSPPFEAEPFFGEYASKAAEVGEGGEGETDADGDGKLDEDKGGKDEGGATDPDEYARPPQEPTPPVETEGGGAAAPTG
jgi:penicillin-binding protein 1A